MELLDYLQTIVKSQASDLFITVGAPPTLKINGSLQAHGNQPLTAEATHALAYSIMNPEQQQIFHDNLEINLAIAEADIGRFRVNIFQQRNHIALVFRHIRSDIPDIDNLGLPPMLKQLVQAKRGLILVVGAASAGKSTTLAAMVEHRNQHATGHIITIEDPIEFVYTHKKAIINQREIGIDTLSYEEALKNTLRQTPDVILIGEIRSFETMNHAIIFAETGHLCLSTLHASTANQALERIMSFFPRESAPQLLMELASNLTAIVCQRLIPTTNGQRVPAVEVLLATPLVKDLIRRNELTKLKDIMEASETIGMQTFDQSLYKLYKSGQITEEDAVLNADSPNNIRILINSQRGITPSAGNLKLED